MFGFGFGFGFDFDFGLEIGALVGALCFNYSVWPDFVICFLISMM